MKAALYKRWKYPRLTRFLWKFGVRFEPTEMMAVIWSEDSWNGKSGGVPVTKMDITNGGYWRIN